MLIVRLSYIDRAKKTEIEREREPSDNDRSDLARANHVILSIREYTAPYTETAR